MSWRLQATLCLALLVPRSQAASVELISNGGFENSQLDGGVFCNQCHMQLSSDSYSGQHSLHVSRREHGFSGVAYEVPMTAGKTYYVRGFIKPLSNPSGQLYSMVEVIGALGQGQYKPFGRTPHVQAGQWAAIGGDYTMPDFVQGKVRVYLQIHDAHVDYLLDDFSVQEVPAIPDLVAFSDMRIDQHRKQDLFVHVTGTVRPSNLQVEITQTGQAFPLGTCVKADLMVDSGSQAYQDFVYNNFNWAVLENALKWRLMEWTEGHPKYEPSTSAVKALRDHGLKVRGHNIFWGGDNHVPAWIKTKSPSQLQSAMETRVQGVVGHFKGMLEHWDVNNENVHLDWFEQHLQDPNITQWMFRETHKVDPNVKLFLNDYNAVSNHLDTMGLVNQGLQMKETNSFLYGIGIQAHFRHPVPPEVLQRRLDEVASVGLPVWVTELSVSEQDDDKKAQMLENYMRVLYGHPSVQGILIWGFWDRAISQRVNALATGDHVTPNAAGRRLQSLWQQQWRTNVTQPLPQGQTHVRGFKGDYSIRVLHNGQVVSQEKFTLGDSPLHLRVPLSGTDSHPQVPHIVVG